MAQAKNTAKYGDLHRRLVFLVLALLVYRIGTHIPVPGIGPDQLTQLFQRQSGGILRMFSLFSGGALPRFTVFALEIMPCISASTIMQLLMIVLSQLESLKKEGQAGQRKITQYTCYGTVVLATFQAPGIAVAFEAQPGLILDPDLMFRATVVITLVTGTTFLMWLGEQITERGLGSGILIIIFGRVTTGLPGTIGGLFELVCTGSMGIFSVILVVAITGAAMFVVVFIEWGQRKILINYAKRRVGNKICGGQLSHLPLKLNMAGVTPLISASSIVLFSATIAGWFAADNSADPVARVVKDLAATLSPDQPAYILLYTVAIIFLCFFCTTLIYNSRGMADNLKKSGAFIPDIRLSKQTTRYIDKILVRLILTGAIYITLVCLLPEFLVLHWSVPLCFGGTSLLIIMVVTVDFMAQVQSYVMSQQYRSLMKKTNFKGDLTLR